MRTVGNFPVRRCVDHFGSTSNMKKYYYAGSTRVAMRGYTRNCKLPTGRSPGEHGDHDRQQRGEKRGDKVLPVGDGEVSSEPQSRERISNIQNDDHARIKKPGSMIPVRININFTLISMPEVSRRPGVRLLPVPGFPLHGAEPLRPPGSQP